jgi:hypothetical protein
MANDSTVKVPLLTSGVDIDNSSPLVNGKVVQRQRTVIGYDDGTLAPQLGGTWGYKAGNLSSSGSVTGSGRCIGIRVFANGTDSSFNIGGGDTINVRSGTGVDVNPGGTITNAVVNWVSGNIDIVVESVS